MIRGLLVDAVNMPTKPLQSTEAQIVWAFQLAVIAQMVEQLFCNQQVWGSTPHFGTILNVLVAPMEERWIPNPQVIGSSPI